MDCLQNKGYTIERCIGSGAFGTVFLAHHIARPGLIAVKKIKKGTQSTRAILQEVNAGRVLDHPNITKIRDNFEDDEHVYIVMDYVSGVDLFRFIELSEFKPLGEFHCRTIFQQIVNAVSYSHSQGIVHLDIKLDNILIDPATHKVTLIDFGLSQAFDTPNGDRVTHRCGSEEYSAPEMNFYSNKAINVSGRQVDSWALGIVLYALFSASFPFNETERYILANSLSRTKRFLKFHFPISPVARDLIERLLEADPSLRISVNEIENHPWLRRQE